MSLATFILARAAELPASKRAGPKPVVRQIKNMSPDELDEYRLEYIRKNHGKKMPHVMASRLKMTTAEMQKFAKDNLGISIGSVRFWNDERNEKLRRLAGIMPRKHIAIELGTTKYGVESQAKKLGITLFDGRGNNQAFALTPEIKLTIIRMSKRGISNKVIAEKIGVSYSTVKNYVKEKGLPLRVITPWKISDLVIIRHSMNEGVSVRHAAHYINRSRMAVLQKVNRMRSESPELWAGLLNKKHLASREEIEAKYLADFGKL